MKGRVNLELFSKVDPFYEPTDILRKDDDFFCEMNRDDHGFLCGLLKTKRPKKILEIGVANGGTTLTIAKTLQMIGIKAEFTSVDLSERWYHDATKETGFIYNLKSDCARGGDHRFLLGHSVAKYIDEIDGNIDFAIIDTTHTMPGEFLDFLTVYPYLAPDAIVVFHDVNLNYVRTQKTSSVNDIRNNSQCIATKSLFSVVGGKKFFGLTTDSDTCLPNIAAIQVDERTKESIPSIFFGIQFTWAYQLEEDVLNEYKQIFWKHYDPACIKFFETAVWFNGISSNICPSLFV